MKIGIDARHFSLENKAFFEEFIKNINSNTTHEFKIYTKNYKSLFDEQVLFFKELQKDKNDLIISFEYTRPIFYKGKVIQIIPSFEKFLYPEEKNTKFVKKYLFLSLFKKSLKQAEKIVVLNKQTSQELNEYLNIDEGKIEIIPAFFTPSPEIKSTINIQNKHSFSQNYILYDAGTGNNKNLKRLVESIKDLDLNIVFLGDKIANDLELRQTIIDNKIQNKTTFAGVPMENELGIYYKQSAGVIFPGLYYSFPYFMSNAMNYNTEIFCSDLEEIKNIFGDKINYFSPDVVGEISKSIKKVTKKEINYENIIKKYNSNDFVSNLLNLIK